MIPRKADFKHARFSGFKEIFVIKPSEVVTEPNPITHDIGAAVGGFLGMGKTECTAQVIFEKQEFCIGEETPVRVIIDNSRCKKPVKGIKVRLKALFEFHPNTHGF